MGRFGIVCEPSGYSSYHGSYMAKPKSVFVASVPICWTWLLLKPSSPTQVETVPTCPLPSTDGMVHMPSTPVTAGAGVIGQKNRRAQTGWESTAPDQLFEVPEPRVNCGARLACGRGLNCGVIACFAWRMTSCHWRNACGLAVAEGRRGSPCFLRSAVEAVSALKPDSGLANA